MNQVLMILQKARSFLGTKENPARSNKILFNNAYYGRVVSGPKYPWCMVFIWYVFHACGLDKLFYGGKKTASCEQMFQWATKNGYITNDPRPGDLALFQFDKDVAADHVGLISEILDEGQFKSFEGNTSTGSDSDGGEVQERIRKRSQVKAFVRIPYTDVTPVPSKPYTHEQFLFEVCTILGVTTAEAALPKTPTISTTLNKKHALVTPLERFLKAYNLYHGEIEADLGKTPTFGPKLAEAVKNYELGYVLQKATGKIPAKGATWKKMLGL